jgi:NADH:ubiquinone oxidoreductase subunit 5 (subunit L)/multisubunit Na+/H+ antiporter MnhA subunit
MNFYIPLFILIPFIGFLISLIPNNHQEKIIYRTVFITLLTHFLLLSCLCIYAYIYQDFNLFYEGPALYKTNASNFSFHLYFDAQTGFFAWITDFILILVSTFSKTYLHREKGFKRFFNNMLFFFLGLTIIEFSGNFETLFAGWEIIGIASFLLVAFYKDRYLPAKNAMKLFSVYRVADISLLLGIWLSHHYFKKSINFQELKSLDIIYLGNDHDIYIQAIPFLFLLAALVKSAQFPFSSMLPRAMEGPTTSSAIFYGSLSVHMGVFLLLRTFPLWDNLLVFKLVVIIFGMITSLFATLIARVQSSVKTQIAYSSIAQIGIIFIEVALGFHTLAIFHFAGNAFLRTYQLLVSPAVLSYLIHDQFFHFVKPNNQITDNFWGRLKISMYQLSIKEFNMDTNMYRYLWKPLKWLGRKLRFFQTRKALVLCALYLTAGFYFIFIKKYYDEPWLHTFSFFSGLLSLGFIFSAFESRINAKNAWLQIVFSQFLLGQCIALNEQFEIAQLFLFLSGIVFAAVLGLIVLTRLENFGQSVFLNKFHGYSYIRPRLSVAFLIACLGLSGFPITPTFIGEDLILGHLHENQIGLTLLISLILILDGLAIYRIYARLFLGPFEKSYNPTAYRSS